MKDILRLHLSMLSASCLLSGLGLQRGRAAPGRSGLGVLAIMKNEALNLREWVDHYLWQGVDKFFIIDNGSTDDPLPIIQKEIDAGLIEYFRRPEPHSQIRHYREVYDAAKIAAKVEWLMMTDLDEFWYSPSGTVKTSLNDIAADVDLVYANWRIFGSGGFVAHPQSLRKELLYRQPDPGRHCNTKWICRTDCIRASRAIDMHKVRWVDSRRVVSDSERFRVNHYVTQSVEYFQRVKMTRGDVSSEKFDSIRTMQYFESFDADATLKDDCLAELVRKA